VHSRKVWQCPLIKKWNLYGSQPVARTTLGIQMRKPHDCAYEPGDHVGIFASNKWDLVSGILARLNLGGIDPDEPMELQVLSETHTSTGERDLWGGIGMWDNREIQYQYKPSELGGKTS
jgi:Sulfite reductase, alpha subunit (flavoprotein)